MQPTQYQASIPEWLGRGNVTASEVPQARYAPQKGKSLATGLEDHPAQESSDKEENNSSHQGIDAKASTAHVPEVESTEYIKLYLQIFKLELEEYMKHKKAHATARSTATPADSVDYNAIKRQRVPVIAEAMDALNAP
ncbi:hypothetical protein C0995_012225 [Termitomyces sp. Mi166|nr:hypothetical protein C0995_012225 [Termitomyces sp. Mi166\